MRKNRARESAVAAPESALQATILSIPVLAAALLIARYLLG